VCCVSVCLLSVVATDRRCSSPAYLEADALQAVLFHFTKKSSKNKGKSESRVNRISLLLLVLYTDTDRWLTDTIKNSVI